MTFLFSDIVGSTDLLTRLGEREWNEVRRKHFSVLREALAEHQGTEIKNTGDGLMAVFGSVINALDSAVTMRQQALQVTVGGTPIGFRIGIATGEATHDQGDWFGAPVVAAARLCALAGPNESYTTGLVHMLAGTQANARFTRIGPRTLKGFDQAIEVFGIDAPAPLSGSMFAQVDKHEHVGGRLVAQLDYWERLPSLQKVRAGMHAALAPLPGDVICDIGCGPGTELIRIAHIVGEHGLAIGVDPSPSMIEEARNRAQAEDVKLELVVRDGRDTGLPADHCDALRIERVIQHVGDLQAFLAEAKRITKPGGRIVVADTDWGSLMIHPGDRELVRRFKTTFELGPMAEPWAGRLLHDGMLDVGLTDVTSAMHPISARAGITEVLGAMFDRFVGARLASRTEIDDLVAELESAQDRGGLVVAFTMFVASGRVPE
jgi:ubiquinone/menaquinone biosynthesis C-methylase UbiE